MAKNVQKKAGSSVARGLPGVCESVRDFAHVHFHLAGSSIKEAPHFLLPRRKFSVKGVVQMTQFDFALFGGFVLALLFLKSAIIWIPNSRVGIVEKLWSRHGSVREGLMALNGEAGFQPALLRGGLHFLFPFQYRVHVLPLVTVAQGKIGYVFARQGSPLPAGQTLAANPCGHFDDVAEFLRQGGQQGPQRQILRGGTYAINLAQFVVFTDEEDFYLSLRRDEDAMFEAMSKLIEEREGYDPVVILGDLVGIVTVHDGPALTDGEVVAPIVGDDRHEADTYHNHFQHADHYLAAGGKRGRQLQVLVEGTYFINRLFATVELIPKSVVDVGYVGVVVSYTGDAGMDVSGDAYKHGELVPVGHRGVWDEALTPGKYAFNTYAGKMIMVPTTNFILKWHSDETGNHRFDENLEEIALITKDAFEPLLPLAVVVHIDYRKAPLVVQRFGDIHRLVEQTLDPMVAAYFKNVAQSRTIIQLIHDRSSIQQMACDEMREKFDEYNLELQEVLIGTPVSPDGKDGAQGNHIETILAQLRSRQIAVEQILTYARQEEAATHERALREAETQARLQQDITQSALSIQIKANEGKAELQRALQQADKMRALAQAEADRVRMLAEAEADKVDRVGRAQAEVIAQQVHAYGDARLQMTRQVMDRFSQAVETAKIDVVPRVMVGGGDAASPLRSVEALMGMLVAGQANGKNGAVVS
jgi:uncharacterized membrane protein YqiK